MYYCILTTCIITWNTKHLMARYASSILVGDNLFANQNDCINNLLGVNVVIKKMYKV